MEMFVLGLQGSPRKNGNTSKLLSAFLHQAESLGAQTRYLDVPRMNIHPCRGCGNCEKKAFCPIDDDMQEVFPLLREADIILMATPVFFYGATAQIKGLIDRSQVLWARKYIHNLEDPGRKWRLGLLLSVGATKGKDLFEGISLTAKYFFDAVGAGFEGGLVYKKIEGPTDIERHPSALNDTRKKAADLVGRFLRRKKILFVCTRNACRSQMAAAFARYHAGDRIDARSAGSAPADAVDPGMVEVMREKGLDMAFCRPSAIDTESDGLRPELVVSMGCGETCPAVPGAGQLTWDLPDPEGESVDFMREVRDEIEKRVKALIGSVTVPITR